MRAATDRRQAVGGAVLGALLAGGVLVFALRGVSYVPLPWGEGFVAALWVLALSIGLGLLPMWRPPPGAWLAVAALVALAAWTAVGLWWTESAERTVDEAARTLGVAGVLALVLVAFGGRAWS